MHSVFKVTGGSDVNMQPMSQFSVRVMNFSIWHEHWSIHLCILSTLLFEIHCFITVKLGTANELGAEINFHNLSQYAKNLESPTSVL